MGACHKSTATFGDLAIGADKQAIDWGGAQRWLRRRAIALPPPFAWVGAGLLEQRLPTCFAARRTVPNATTPQTAALADVQQKLKQSFDPYNVFPTCRSGLPRPRTGDLTWGVASRFLHH